MQCHSCATGPSRHRLIVSRSVLLLTAMLGFINPSVHAAPSDPAAARADDDVEVIVVKAYRTPVPIGEADSAISVVNDDVIEQRQQSFAADLLRDLPGVSLSRASTNGSLTQVRVRGSEANHLLVVIDGVEVNDPAGGDEFNFGSLTSYDIASMELVRGPQSALWGSDAMAGILNITTRTGSGPLGASAFVQSGSFGTLSGGGRLGTASEKGSLGLSASRYETDGVSAAAGGSEKDGYENVTVGLNGRYHVSDLLELGFSSRYTEATLEFDGDSVDGLPVDSFDVTDTEMLIVSADGGLTLLDGRWTSTMRVTWLDTDNETTGGFDSDYAATRSGYYFQSTLLLGREAGMDRHRLTLGVDYEDEDYRQRTAFASQDQGLDNTGVVLEYYTLPTTQMILSASVRHDDNSQFEDVTTYRATASYRFAATGTRIRGTVGTGQKRPTFTERFGFSPDFFIGNPDLKPEQNRGFDIGVDQALLDGRFTLGATYFNEKLEDEIVLMGFPSTPVNLDGRSQREGVEVELTGELAANLVLTANYTYTDSRQGDSTLGEVREIRRPKHQAAVNLNRGFERVNVNLNVSYTGSQTDTVFSFPTRTVTLDSYMLVNLTGEYVLTPRLTLFARAENLFDEAQVDVAGLQNPGRGFYGGVRVATGR